MTGSGAMKIYRVINREDDVIDDQTFNNEADVRNEQALEGENFLQDVLLSALPLNV